jgi:hypothetical protein
MPSSVIALDVSCPALASGAGAAPSR